MGRTDYVTIPNVILDAGTIIHLEEIDCLRLLLDFKRLIIPDSILFTDDASARLVAKTLGIRAYGTIGVLLRAIRRSQITPHEAIGKLEEIPLKSTLFIRRSLLREIIEEVKREFGLG